MASMMRYTDRTRIELGWTCPQARAWGFDYQGRGLTPAEPVEALVFGDALARQVAVFRQQAAVRYQPQANGSHSEVLLYGLLLAYAATIWPSWQSDYDLVATELECAYQLTPTLTYNARPDAIVRRKEDKTLWYLEDKTTSLDPQTFVKAWDKQVQVHATAFVAGQQLQAPIAGTIVQGWAKGYQKAGTIYSPLAFAWRKDYPTGAQWSHDYRPGWGRARLDTYPGGLTRWISQLPPEVVRAQFPVTLPIPLRRDLVERFFAQVSADDVPAPARPPTQHFSQCDEFGKWRRPCAYRDCCWSPTVGRDPIASGLYVWRTPHHPEPAEPDIPKGAVC